MKLSLFWLLKTVLSTSNKQLLAFLICFMSASLATAVEEGTTIIGNQEAPTVLNVVPWKSKELSVDPWETQKGPSNSMLNQVLKPLDREELLREVEYFDMLNEKEENVE